MVSERRPIAGSFVRICTAAKNFFTPLSSSDRLNPNAATKSNATVSPKSRVVEGEVFATAGTETDIKGHIAPVAMPLPQSSITLAWPDAKQTTDPARSVKEANTTIPIILSQAFMI
jgi:hypothetical protein